MKLTFLLLLALVTGAGALRCYLGTSKEVVENDCLPYQTACYKADIANITFFGCDIDNCEETASVGKVRKCCVSDLCNKREVIKAAKSKGFFSWLFG
ncbi:hypothetical protein AAVH_31763 [Aphelenchoides avenae]|nr:hypothetical protein AAVH_31763 [Aphelenchus avenae]